jgi:hypothetical protein
VSLTAAETTGPAETTYRHSASLVGPATPRWWRQSARRSMPATRRAPKHGNNPRPTRLGYTPRRPLHPRRHSLRPPGRPSDAQCHSLQRRQPAQQTIDTANHRPAQHAPAAETAGPENCTYLNQLCPFVHPFVVVASIIQQRTIFKHPGQTMGCTGYSPFSAL